eukprot:166307_1
MKTQDRPTIIYAYRLDIKSSARIIVTQSIGHNSGAFHPRIDPGHIDKSVDGPELTQQKPGEELKVRVDKVLSGDSILSIRHLTFRPKLVTKKNDEYFLIVVLS